MSKILIVSHQFLPHQSPRTTRWKMIYDELNNRGHEVMILTGTPQEEKKENIIYVGNKNPEGVVEKQPTAENANLSGGRDQDKTEESVRVENRNLTGDREA